MDWFFWFGLAVLAGLTLCSLVNLLLFLFIVRYWRLFKKWRREEDLEFADGIALRVVAKMTGQVEGDEGGGGK